MENLFNNQELLEFVIISFLLVTLMFDSGVILVGEIKYWSLLGVKGLNVMVEQHINVLLFLRMQWKYTFRCQMKLLIKYMQLINQYNIIVQISLTR